MAELQIGQKAPDFTLSNQDNKQISLKDLKTKWLILYFYPKDDTPGCTIEALDFTKSFDELKSLNVEILGISPDSSQSHCDFIKKRNLKIQLLSDPEHKILETYNVWKEKTFLFKKFMGVERTTYLIDPNGIIKHIWNNVNVKGHIDEVKQKLNQFI